MGPKWDLSDTMTVWLAPQMTVTLEKTRLASIWRACFNEPYKMIRHRLEWEARMEPINCPTYIVVFSPSTKHSQHPWLVEVLKDLCREQGVAENCLEFVWTRTHV